MSTAGLYDPTSIFEAEKIERGQREGWAKMILYVVTFFYSLAGSVIL